MNQKTRELMREIVLHTICNYDSTPIEFVNQADTYIDKAIDKLYEIARAGMTEPDIPQCPGVDHCQKIREVMEHEGVSDQIQTAIGKVCEECDLFVGIIVEGECGL